MYPALVEFDRILSQVNGVMNAVEVESDFAGGSFFRSRSWFAGNSVRGG